SFPLRHRLQCSPASRFIKQPHSENPPRNGFSLLIAAIFFQNQYGLLCSPFGVGSQNGKTKVSSASDGPSDLASPLLMVGTTLREHLTLRGVEGIGVLPDGFAFANAGVATHVRRIVLRDHAIDQELTLAGAVVHWR